MDSCNFVQFSHLVSTGGQLVSTERSGVGRRAPGQIAVRTDACPGQMPSGPASSKISSGMPAGMRAGYPAVLVMSTQKQLISATAGRKPRDRLATALTGTASPCCRADMGIWWNSYLLDRFANLPTCDYFSQTSSFDLSGMDGPAGCLSSRQHSARGHRGTQTPPHKKVAVRKRLKDTPQETLLLTATQLHFPKSQLHPLKQINSGSIFFYVHRSDYKIDPPQYSFERGNLIDRNS